MWVLACMRLCVCVCVADPRFGAHADIPCVLQTESVNNSWIGLSCINSTPLLSSWMTGLEDHMERQEGGIRSPLSWVEIIVTRLV